MHKSDSALFVGVDVGKFELTIARSDTSGVESITNDQASLERWVKGLEDTYSVVMEATGSYHLLLATLLQNAGHRVFVVNGLKISQYRKSVGQRAKTDPCDARLLLRYVQHEHTGLRDWQPASRNISHIRRLLRRRGELVKTKVALKQSLSDIPEIDTQEATSSIERTLVKLSNLIAIRLQDEGVAQTASRCQQITGVGPLTSAALVSTYYTGTFTRVSSFIAFLGLDLIACDSGQKRGRRRLSKQGDHETRRLLHNAAMAACRVAGPWKACYEHHVERGMARTQALVIIARKIARVAFSLLKTGANYDAQLAFKGTEKVA